MADKVQTVKHICNVKVSQLLEGVNILKEEKIIVFKKGDSITACRNRCMHHGGTFARCDDIEESHVLKCRLHGWKLDCQSMQYVNPVGGIKQPMLVVDSSPEMRDPYDLTDPDEMSVFEVTPLAPWLHFPLSTPLPEDPLAPGDFTIRYFSHAAILVRAGGASIFMDPWLTGPAFTRGWWLTHKPPADWLATLSTVNSIYISHNHSDHLNEHTLRELCAVRPDIDIIVPAFDSFSCDSLVTKLGFSAVRRVPFGQWQPLGTLGARFMLLEDFSGRHDSAILVDYKGKVFLNTVDCNNPNNAVLPKVDVLFSQFAGGASGYPVCWPELYPVDHIQHTVDRNRRKLVLQAANIAKAARPTLFVPFAGYFTEAHPGDAAIRAVNVKNSPAEFCQGLMRTCPGLATWLPRPGGIVDMASVTVTAPGNENADMAAVDWQFDHFVAEINSASLRAPSLRTLEGLLTYFKWAGFCGADLLLHVLVVDDEDSSFASVTDAFGIDFSLPLAELRVEALDADQFEFKPAYATAGRTATKATVLPSLPVGTSGGAFASAESNPLSEQEAAADSKRADSDAEETQVSDSKELLQRATQGVKPTGAANGDDTSLDVTDSKVPNGEGGSHAGDAPAGPGARTHNPGGRYLRMRVRSGPFYHVLYHGLSWEELSIGYQCRFYREPDAYNFDFWNHFQNKLPASTPPW
eukprot:jgi/Mesvir1/11920/Mv00258-RA.1